MTTGELTLRRAELGDLRRQLQRSRRRPARHRRWFESDPLWFKRAVFYEIHIRGFADGNDDGIGDFVGLTERLDYLAVARRSTASGCCRSTRRRCGTAATTSPTTTRSIPTTARSTTSRAFIEAAHQRGIRVIADLVMNHTSSDHPWFQEARRATRLAEARLVRLVATPTTRTPTPASSSSTPSRRTGRGTRSPAQYYWHRFFSHQPDLNFDNPEVRDAMLDVMRFWLDLGLDGFRLDAVPYLFEREGTNCENLPETHAFLQAGARRRSTPTTPTACCSPRRTSGRPTSSSTSATATSATWRSSSR